jgi:uncharacterized membrane protein YdbT with pleckstrin-like domain
VGYVKDALSENEKIILRTRKHLIVLLWPFTYNLLILVFIVFAAFAAAIEEPKLLSTILTLAVFPFCFLIYSCLKWWTEEYYLTTHRVIQSEGIINKRVSDSSLEKVNDVVLWQSLIGRILDFGDVKILTASEIGVNNFETIKSPVRFKTAMLNQKEALGADEHPRGTERQEETERPEGTERTEGTEKPPAESKGRISDLISGLEKLRQEGALTDKEFAEKKTELLAQM